MIAIRSPSVHHPITIRSPSDRHHKRPRRCRNSQKSACYTKYYVTGLQSWLLRNCTRHRRKCASPSKVPLSIPKLLRRGSWMGPNGSRRIWRWRACGRPSESCHVWMFVLKGLRVDTSRHIWMSDSTCRHGSCHVLVLKGAWASQWVLSRVNESCHMWMSHCTYGNESWHIWEWVMSRYGSWGLMCEWVTWQVNESCHVLVRKDVWASKWDLTRVNESCHMWMSHGT